MATDEANTLYKIPYQICLCMWWSLFAIRKPTCFYKRFKGIDSISKDLQTVNICLKWLEDANVESILVVNFKHFWDYFKCSLLSLVMYINIKIIQEFV